MALAGNRVRALGGGLVAVKDGEVLAELPLPIAGLMTDQPAEELVIRNEALQAALAQLQVSPEVEPFLMLAFTALPVIPYVKMTTFGLADVGSQQILSLLVEA